MITDKSVIGSTLGVCCVMKKPTADHAPRPRDPGPSFNY